jgi:Domain of unknown function (DUF4375)
MNDKVPCAECGTEIRVRNPDRMKGLCVRCYSKSKQRKPNPFSDLYVDLIHRVHETDGGFGALSEAEKLYYSVALLRNEINNGGFHQYFFNSSGNYYSYIEAGLQLLGVTQTLTLLREAKEIVFPGMPVTTDIKVRRTHMHALADSDPAFTGKLDELTSGSTKVRTTLLPDWRPSHASRV